MNQDLTVLDLEDITIIFGRNLEIPTIVRTAAAQNCDDGVSLKNTQWIFFQNGCKLPILTEPESGKMCILFFHKSTIH